MKIQISFYSEKISNLYLMKIHINFVVVVVFFFFNINVFSNLLQILKFKVELNLKHVNQLLNNKLNMWTWQKIWTRLYQQWIKSNIHLENHAMNKTHISDKKEKNKQRVRVRTYLHECTLQWKKYFRNQRSLTSLRSKIRSLTGKKFLKSKLLEHF